MCTLSKYEGWCFTGMKNQVHSPLGSHFMTVCFKLQEMAISCNLRWIPHASIWCKIAVFRVWTCMLSYKNQKFPYAHAVFSHKNVCVFIFEKLGSKKRVVKRVGSVVMPILAFKSKNSSKNWFSEPYKRSIPPTSMRLIFGIYTTLSTTLFSPKLG